MLGYVPSIFITKNLQQQLLEYPPSRVKKLLPNAIPTLHLSTALPLPASSNDLFDTGRSTTLSNTFTSNKLSLNTGGSTTLSNTSTSNDGSSTAETFDGMSPAHNTETNMSLQICDLQLQLVTLEMLSKQKERENQHLEQRMQELLSSIFSPGQIRMLLKSSVKRIKWSFEDIAHAISLRCVSPKAYRYMQNVLKMPLPGFLT
ncbi:uncharacterized protein LOC105197628 [Solenopsis invicta]|uniref:uncharacterized protein LOC105197628 n=1 Tax=Solenopsis invicta TaxID=13686 RepID=UPI000595F21E|nr:uncharacterized protein LOC105197628 [Solenopsis invicta]XP_039311753.1 uncharacterized protein LOC105197628 [Solenopsis invicta]